MRIYKIMCWIVIATVFVSTNLSVGHANGLTPETPNDGVINTSFPKQGSNEIQVHKDSLSLKERIDELNDSWELDIHENQCSMIFMKKNQKIVLCIWNEEKSTYSPVAKIEKDAQGQYFFLNKENKKWVVTNIMQEPAVIDSSENIYILEVKNNKLSVREKWTMKDFRVDCFKDDLSQFFDGKCDEVTKITNQEGKKCLSVKIHDTTLVFVIGEDARHLEIQIEDKPFKIFKNSGWTGSWYAVDKDGKKYDIQVTYFDAFQLTKTINFTPDNSKKIDKKPGEDNVTVFGRRLASLYKLVHSLVPNRKDAVLSKREATESGFILKGNKQEVYFKIKENGALLSATINGKELEFRLEYIKEDKVYAKDSASNDFYLVHFGEQTKIVSTMQKIKTEKTKEEKKETPQKNTQKEKVAEALKENKQVKQKPSEESGLGIDDFFEKDNSLPNAIREEQKKDNPEVDKRLYVKEKENKSLQEASKPTISDSILNGIRWIFKYTLYPLWLCIDFLGDFIIQGVKKAYYWLATKVFGDRFENPHQRLMAAMLFLSEGVPRTTHLIHTKKDGKDVKYFEVTYMVKKKGTALFVYNVHHFYIVDNEYLSVVYQGKKILINPDDIVHFKMYGFNQDNKDEKFWIRIDEKGELIVTPQTMPERSTRFKSKNYSELLKIISQKDILQRKEALEELYYRESDPIMHKVWLLLGILHAKDIPQRKMLIKKMEDGAFALGLGKITMNKDMLIPFGNAQLEAMLSLTLCIMKEDDQKLRELLHPFLNFGLQLLVKERKSIISTKKHVEFLLQSFKDNLTIAKEATIANTVSTLLLLKESGLLNNCNIELKKTLFTALQTSMKNIQHRKLKHIINTEIKEVLTA